MKLKNEMKAAMQKLTSIGVREADADSDSDKDLEFAMVVWQQVAGVNFKRGMTTLENTGTYKNVHKMAVYDEQLRFLTHMHLHYAYTLDDMYDAASPTTLESYVNAGRSHLYSSMSSSSALLQGLSSRLVLLWRSCGARAFRDWFDNHKGEAMDAFRAVSMVNASAARRQAEQLSPLKAFGIHDPALRGSAEAHAIATDLAYSTRAELGDNLAGRHWTHIREQCEGHPDVEVKMVASHPAWGHWRRVPTVSTFV